ncbi:hypothetical protein FA95DRAFT_1555019 [Auriscalpium vulgare]|uniref:Uncharacterized protein n=1 Tax=Auriscalpium vulgare TaxID=40419 RepID=A0ACB8S590_9AGAM|nr:hypothetical protein FA95DRAFT_1555019 [Auriscalpium vulgare]
MASVDTLQALGAALAVPADSKEQAELLATLRASLEVHTQTIPILCTTLIKNVAGPGDSLLKRWVLDLLHFAIARAGLPHPTRTSLAQASLDVLAGLLQDANPSTVKVVVAVFASVYPLLFRDCCTNRNARQLWDTLAQAKNRILELVWAPNVNTGVRLAAIKFLQRVLLVQTRGVADPRLQRDNDPNLAMVPGDHPFIPTVTLEQEGIKLMEGLIRLLYSSQSTDVLTALVNSCGNLMKARPVFAPLLVSSLAAWTPAFLVGLPYNSIKGVEKSIRILLTHLSRTTAGQPFAREISEALAVQGARLDRASAEEKARKAAEAESRKRPPSAEFGANAKRIKLEPDAPPPSAILAAFDFTTLPAALVTELIVANLQAFSEEALQALVSAYRQTQGGVASSSKMGPGQPPPTVLAAPSPSAAVKPSAAALEKPSASSTPVPAARAPPSAPAAERERERESAGAGPSSVVVKDEPVDPLKMDIDEEEMEYEPDKLNMELEPMHEDTIAPLDVKDLLSIDFKVPPPRQLSDPERESVVKSTMARIWGSSSDLSDGSSAGVGMGPQDLWMLLIVRMITRVVDPDERLDKGKGKAEDGEGEEEDEMLVLYERQDRLRRTLCDYIMADFSGRIRLATTWMNEEWYNDEVRLSRDADWRPNYDAWLGQIVAAYQTHLDGKDRTFARFLLDLPSVPPDVFALLRDLCVEPERMQVGFTTLREFVVQRPTHRAEAINILLELTTHSEKITRNAAIITVKRWVGDSQSMDGMVRDFAVQLLRRLQSRPPGEKSSAQADADAMDDEEDGQLPQEDMLQTPYLPEQLAIPAQKPQVLQHVELLFALSAKAPEFLDEIFAAYGEMDVSVQEAIQELITQLIKSLGPSHGKLLTLMRKFPPGADTLALRVLNIFTEHGRPSSQLVALVKSLIAERDLDARFLIPIIAEMDKADIVKHLPRIVGILNGTPEPKNLVRSVFGAIVTTPPQTFGSVTSNLPRVRQSELLTPAELMVLLHDNEKEIGRKPAMEAIGICFSMTDVYRSEILGVVMQQIVDEPVIPTLFLRTVIQAVKTYKSLVGFVSTTLLSRLITKKIWQDPLLWEGFIRCAQVIAPASFGALLQLPKEQLRELVDKQPNLKSGLRDYVIKKAGNKARVAGFLEIFGDDEANANAAVPAAIAAPVGGPVNGATPPPAVPPAQPVAAEPTPS